jgi:hypothetical protein
MDLGAEQADILTSEIKKRTESAEEVVAEVTKPVKKATDATKTDMKKSAGSDKS